VGVQKLDYDRTYTPDRLNGNNIVQALAGTSGCEKQIKASSKGTPFEWCLYLDLYIIFIF
jgi:hypothetical protein